MTVSFKFLFLGGLILLLLLGAASYGTYYFYTKSNSLEEVLTTTTTEMQEAKLEVGRAHTKIEDANKLVSQLSKQLQDEIKKHQATLTLYADLEARYEAEKKKQKIVVKVVYQDRIIDLPTGRIFIRLQDGSYKEVTSMPMAYQDYRIDINGDAIKQEISYKLHQKFRAKLVESKAPGGTTNHYAEVFELCTSPSWIPRP